MESTLEQFFKIRINTIRPLRATTFNLYVLINKNMHLYLHAGDLLEKNKLEQLNAKDTGSYFYVKEADRLSYKSYVHDQMVDHNLNSLEKAVVLRESSLTLVEELFENPDVHQALDSSRPLIRDFIDFMENEPQAMGHLIGLSGHDFYTYNHSLDVSIYSLGLGKALGFSKKELEELGVGSLFHDIGKRNVSLDILCKRGPLSDAEWAQMQRHPTFGLAILNDLPDVSEATKACCFEHHESWSGNGYPQQLVADEIHPFARIIAITDTYDALTTQRSYNVPMKPFDAVTMMKEKLAGRYDPEMLKAMYSVLFKLTG